MIHPRTSSSILLLGLLAAVPAPALAAWGTSPASGFVEQIVRRALAEQGLQLDSAPAGKTIENIVIVSEPVIAEGDPLPQWLNSLHVTTRHDVIERELLFRRDEPWNREHVEESERNLRNYLYVTAAHIVPCRGSTPDRVVALVVTRDLWSIGVESDFSLVGWRIEALELDPTEHNLAGRNTALGLEAGMDPAVLRFGFNYADRRLRGRELSAGMRAAIITNRDSRQTEGNLASLSLARPLYTLEDRWGWSIVFYRLNDIYRVFADGEVAGVRMESTGEVLPYSYRRRFVQPSLLMTHSRGHIFKQNLTLGWRAELTRYELPDFITPPDPASVSEFRQTILPRSVEAGIFFAGFQAYEARYIELRDIDTFAIPEDFRLGPELTLQTNLAVEAFGLTSSYFEPLAGLGSVWALGDDYLALHGSASIRYEEGALPGSPWIDRIWSLELRNIGPRWGYVRVHTVARMIRSFRDAENTQVSLGGDSGLRGYPSAYFMGTQLWTAAAEVRTAPRVIRTAHVGLAGFVDTGDAFNNGDPMRLHASAGAGVRIGLPQLNRAVLSMDVAVPFERITGRANSYFSAGFGQPLR